MHGDHGVERAVAGCVENFPLVTFSAITGCMEWRGRSLIGALAKPFEPMVSSPMIGIRNIWNHSSRDEVGFAQHGLEIIAHKKSFPIAHYQKIEKYCAKHAQ